MSLESSKPDFNILSHALTEILNDTMKKLAEQPELLMKCIQQAGLPKINPYAFNKQDDVFLKERKIIEYIDGAFSMKAKFLSPWDRIFKDLNVQLNEFKPSADQFKL